MLILVATWPLSPPVAGTGIDGSYGIATHLTGPLGLAHGNDVVFTYGPLGWLFIPVLTGPGSGPGACLTIFGMVALALALTAVTTARLGRAILVFGAVSALSLFVVQPFAVYGTAELAFVLVAVLALEWALGSDRMRSVARARDEVIFLAVPGVLAIATAFLVLAKFGTGLAAAGVLAIACVRRDWRPGVVAAGACISTLAALWFATGQGVAGVSGYLRGSIELARGFSSAMGADAPGRAGEQVAAVAVVAVIGSLAWAAVRARPPTVRVRFLVALGVAFVFLVQNGFIRHDLHAVRFFGGAALVSLVLWGRVPRSQAVMATTLTVVLTAAAAGVGLGAVADVVSLERVRAARRWADAVATPGGRAETAAGTRAAMRSFYAFTPAELDRLRGRTVHIEPWESALAFAYPEIAWRPLPVYQSYQAYTGWLDSRNASALTRDRAPDVVIREQESIDGRNPRFESPSVVLELLCRYRQVSMGSRFQILERTPPRCKAPVAADAAVGGRRVGRTFTAPPSRPDQIMVARFTLDRTVADRVRALWREPPIDFTVRDVASFRFIPGHSGNWHVMSVPACLGWDARAFEPSPYARFTLSIPATVEFATIDFLC